MTIKNILERLDSMSSAEHKPTGPKFPGYWKADEPAAKSHSRMVGSAQESVLKELDKTAKDTRTKRNLEKNYSDYKLSEKISTDIEADITKRFGPPPARISFQTSAPIEPPISPAKPSNVEVRPVPEPTKIDIQHQPIPNAIRQPEGFGPGRPPGASPVPYAKDSDIPTLSPRQRAIQDIATLNNIADPNKIRIGQVIKLPDGSSYTVAKGDNLWNISKGKFRGSAPAKPVTNENFYKKFKLFLEYGNAQDPNAQTTSPKSNATQQQQQDKEQQDQKVDVASAKSLASSIKPALPPSVDSNTVASALTKINDQNSGRPAKPLTQPEQMAMGPVNALFARAAETPQTSTELATILRNVSTLMKKGKA